MSIPEAGSVPKRKISVALKILFIGFLMLVLLIPTLMISFLVQERKGRQDEASREIFSTWAGEQTVDGPVLVVPYQVEEYEASYGMRLKTYYAYFLPEQLKVQGEAKVEERARRIFKVPVYTSQLLIQGSFKDPDFSALALNAKTILWNQAFLRLGLSDPKGIRESVQLVWNGQTLPFQPGSASGSFLPEGIEVPLPLAAHKEKLEYAFQIQLKLAGGQSLAFLPLGRETEVKLRSSWPHPQFMGEFLPENRQIDAQGFESNWKVVEMARGFPQSFTEQKARPFETREKSFGVKFMKPIDIYSLSDRSVKYALLFIFFTFTAFFLFEVLGDLRIHPVQYLLVGLALCVFYLLLLSLSEHIAFGWAYAVAAAATVGLISSYVSLVLKKRGRIALMSLLLGGLYGFLYVLLQLEDFALLLGSLGLFSMLALVMFLTRKINWYEVGKA